MFYIFSSIYSVYICIKWNRDKVHRCLYLYMFKRVAKQSFFQCHDYIQDTKLKRKGPKHHIPQVLQYTRPTALLQEFLEKEEKYMWYGCYHPTVSSFSRWAEEGRSVLAE